MSVKMSADTADLLYAVPEAVQFCFCVPDLGNHRNTETHTFIHRETQTILFMLYSFIVLVQQCDLP